MIRRARSWRLPQELAIFGEDGNVVDAGLAATHVAVLVELPLLVAVSAEPIAGIVVPLVLEAHSDVILVECPELFDQAIVEFLGPLAPQKRDDRLASLKELGAIAPAAV